MCCSPWGRRELDMTEQLKNDNKSLKKHPGIPWCPVVSTWQFRSRGPISRGTNIPQNFNWKKRCYIIKRLRGGKCASILHNSLKSQAEYLINIHHQCFYNSLEVTI